MVRTHPQWLKVKELVLSGRIGEVRSMLGVFSYTNRDPANIRNRPDFGGGALMDIGCYLVNASRFIFGREPLRVTGAIERDPEMGTDRLTSILLDFGTGHAAGHLQHADGALSESADLRHDRSHRADDSVQRAHPIAPAGSSSTPARISSAEGFLTSISTSATSTRSRATCSRRRSSTTRTCPCRSKTR